MKSVDLTRIRFFLCQFTTQALSPYRAIMYLSHQTVRMGSKAHLELFSEQIIGPKCWSIASEWAQTLML